MRVGRRDGDILYQLQTLYNLGAVGGLTDGRLLERFATDEDEAAELAFSALVERHEAMVWRVCAAVLRDEHAAEDAFQATFLVLVRKARTLWVRDSLGPWLHQVAYRTAIRLRSTIVRRRGHERRCAERRAAPRLGAEPPHDFDCAAAIHEELGRLPEKYRAPIVLCDLEGRTHQEAARSLGWPIGTVKSRQSHGRGLIRDRLARRGVGLAVAGAGGVFETLKSTAVAAIPKGVSRGAVGVAMQQSARLATGAGASAQVLALAQGALRGLLWGQLRFLAVATLAAGIAAGGAGLHGGGPQEPGSNDDPPASDGAPGKSAPASGMPRADRRAQELATRKARASYEIARLTRELAEIAVEEYLEVDYPRERATVEGEIKLADSDVARAKDRVRWAESMFKKGYVSRAQLVSEDLAFQKAKFALEQVQGKMKVLEGFTKGKTVKEL
jgi:RNA polymerase sigma factor (sigma-70 family)